MKSILKRTMTAKLCKSDDDKYDYVPPEGGWGYLVCVGLSVIFVSTALLNYKKIKYKIRHFI